MPIARRGTKDIRASRRKNRAEVVHSSGQVIRFFNRNTEIPLISFGNIVRVTFFQNFLEIHNGVVSMMSPVPQLVGELQFEKKPVYLGN